MGLRTSLRRSSNYVAAVSLSCVGLIYILSIIIARQNAQNFGACNDGIEYLLSEYKVLADGKKTLQKQRYLEVKELKSNLKKTTVDLRLKEESCSSDIRSLNESVHMWQQKTREMQRLLDGAFSTMDRSSVVLTAVLQALQQAEQRVDVLERQLAGNGTSAGAGHR